MEKHSVKFVTIFIALFLVAKIKARPSSSDSNDMSYSLTKSDRKSASDKNQQLEFIKEEYSIVEDKVHNIFTGQYYELNCSIESQLPMSNIFWIRGNDIENQVEILRAEGKLSLQNVTDDKEGHVFQIGSRYIIDCATKDDEDEYSCIALNSNNEVNVKTSYVNIIEHDTNKLECNEEHGPVITEQVVTLLTTPGSNVTLYCKVSDNSKITWFRTYEGKEPEFLDVDGEILKLNSITWDEHHAFYTCVVTSEHGKAAGSTYLYPMVENIRKSAHAASNE